MTFSLTTKGETLSLGTPSTHTRTHMTVTCSQRGEGLVRGSVLTEERPAQHTGRRREPGAWMLLDDTAVEDVATVQADLYITMFV